MRNCENCDVEYKPENNHDFCDDCDHLSLCQVCGVVTQDEGFCEDCHNEKLIKEGEG